MPKMLLHYSLFPLYIRLTQSLEIAKFKAIKLKGQEGKVNLRRKKNCPSLLNFEYLINNFKCQCTISWIFSDAIDAELPHLK